MNINPGDEERSMRLDLREVQRVVNVLFDDIIERRGVTEIRLERVFYWMVPQDRKFDLDNEPTEWHVGSLADDWDFVKGNLAEDPLPVAHSLTEVAPIICAIGEVLGAQLAGKGG